MSYPVSLRLRGKTCVVVGGGAVAARKVTGLLQAGASVVVISPTLDASLRESVDAEEFQWLRVHWQAEILQRFSPTLVFAATNEEATNQAVAAEARSLGALVNVVDDAAAGDFSNMAELHRPPLLIALDSGGSSPALVRWLRDRIADCVGEEHAIMARWLGELRPQIRAEIPEQEQRRCFYNSVLESDVLALLGSDQVDEARSLLQSLVLKSG